MYFEKSRTTATLQHCPASEVPPPRAEERGAEFAAEGDGGDDVIVVAGKDDADWDLAIVRAVRGIQGAGAVVETDFALDLYLKRFFEAGGVDFRMLCGSGAGG